MAKNHNIQRIVRLVRGLVRDQADATGRNIFEYDADNKFTLSEAWVNASSIQVYVNGNILNPLTDWVYDVNTNRVIIDIAGSGNGLVFADTILILYSFYKKYSDNEIIGYIESSLCEFAHHRYKKLFQLDDDNDVISVDADNVDVTSVNDAGITLKEQQFIAIIAAIIIDPQNVRIKTPDFEYTPPQHKSKQDQLADAFMQFNRFIGSVEYLEDDNDSSAFWRFSQ